MYAAAAEQSTHESHKRILKSHILIDAGKDTNSAHSNELVLELIVCCCCHYIFIRFGLIRMREHIF